MAFQVVTIHGKDPFERGKQHGSAAKELIQKGVCRYQERFEKNDHVSWKTVREKAVRFVPFLEKEYEDLLDEVKGDRSRRRYGF